MKDNATQPNVGKFQDPFVTAKGEQRAHVELHNPKTLWVNTGTLCNIECVNCYIDSSPTNDALVYFPLEDLQNYLDQVVERGWPVSEIGFTGGEPFMNPEMNAMAELALSRGYSVLILTNAMLPMMRKSVRNKLAELALAYPNQLTLRISLDHHDSEHHDTERGAGSFAKTIVGMEWLRDQGITMAVAGRTVWGEAEDVARAGYQRLFDTYGFDIDAYDPSMTVLFPEMDETIDVPEITTECWGILNKSPNTMMCSSSRMLVRRKGAGHASVLACTLLAYDPQFELGQTLAEAERPVQLNHPHCAKFCVLGGASCSG